MLLLLLLLLAVAAMGLALEHALGWRLNAHGVESPSGIWQVIIGEICSYKTSQQTDKCLKQWGGAVLTHVPLAARGVRFGGVVECHRDCLLLPALARRLRRGVVSIEIER